MRLLLDQCISSRVADILRGAGQDVIHASELGLSTATDATVLQAAVDTDRVLVTADSDFGGILAATNQNQPSVILFRGEGTRRPQNQATLLLANLDQVSSDLTQGAIVIIGQQRLRVRMLPIQP